MNANELKQKACEVIDMHRDEIIALGEDIFRHPELGYKETRTSQLMRKTLEELHIQDVESFAITGLKGWLRGKTSRARVAVIGELDAVLSLQHPCADEKTGAAHACGHHAQLAVLAGCAMALQAVHNQLDGDVCFMAAPAEEYIEITYRRQLKEKGAITFLGGKQEMIVQNQFSDIDLAMMVHGETGRSDTHIVIQGKASGFIGKEIHFTGKEAHAGGAPWEGVNALNAACLAIQAIHTQRETFRDEDHVRVHPIITKGGDMVNTVPADVRMESYVRAETLDAIKSANAKVNRAVTGAAYAVGAQVVVDDLPGYLPLNQNLEMSRLFAENAKILCPEALVEEDLPFSGSTDMGDLSWLFPVIQPTVSGFEGSLHSCDFHVSQPESVYILPAKIMVCTVIDLLYDEAKKACAIRDAYPKRTPAEYVSLWNKILEEKQ